MGLSDRLRDAHESGDCGGYLDGLAEMAEALEGAKPKIKMTKALPTESGWYYYAVVEGMLPRVVFVDDELQREGNIINGRAQMIHIGSVGGYWAKVDESMFAFEG